MNEQLYKAWKAEEEAARMVGWDFSHIYGRYEEEDDLPWDFRAVIGERLRPEHRLLDIDTGGGEVPALPGAPVFPDQRHRGVSA